MFLNKYIAPAIEGFTFGADPELFVVDSTKGNIVSCHDLLPGTKANPHAVQHGAVQVDGTAAEFNIDPASSFEEFDRNIVAVTEQLQKMLPDTHYLIAVAAHQYHKEYFETLPYSAIELGCMPDYDAWTGKRNPKPRASGRPTLRTAAGHVHIGWSRDDGKPHNTQDPGFLAECNLLIQLMDWHVGAWACTVDQDVTRRALYGKAGACRYKPYGVEYRTLSNFWVMDADHRRQMWNRMQNAVEEFVMLRETSLQADIPAAELIRFINTGEMHQKISAWVY